MSNFKQIWLLLWKNYSLQKRSIVSTLLELAVPALFAVILIPIRKIVKSDQYLNDTTFPAFSFNALPDDLLPSDEFFSNYNRYLNMNITHSNNLRDGLWTFAYQPNTTMLNKIMKKVSKDLVINAIRMRKYF